MKRYNVSQKYGFHDMEPNADGEYVRYSDHVEAMKRIAGAPVAQGLTLPQMEMLRALLVSIRPEYGTPGSRDVEVGRQQKRIDAALAILAQAAPSASAQPAKLDADLLTTIREAAAKKAEGAITKDGRAVFINYGDSEQQMLDGAEMACPHCGGSGHKDDVRPVASPAALTDEQIRAIARKYCRFVFPGVYSIKEFDCEKDFLNCARALLAASPADQVEDARKSSVLCISAKELANVLELAAPDAFPMDFDRDHEQMDTEMCIGRLSGSLDDDGTDTGPGLFAWYTEYPEEGVIPLRLDRDVRATIDAAMSASKEGA